MRLASYCQSHGNVRRRAVCYRTRGIHPNPAVLCIVGPKDLQAWVQVAHITGRLITAEHEGLDPATSAGKTQRALGRVREGILFPIVDAHRP